MAKSHLRSSSLWQTSANFRLLKICSTWHVYTRTLTVTDPDCAPQFKDKVMFTLMNDREGRVLNIIPPDHSRDLISGQTFYIRSATNANEHWYCPRPNAKSSDLLGSVIVHPTHRTLFRISRTEHDSQGTVMIRSDAVTIADVVTGTMLAVEDGCLLMNGAGVASGYTFKLSDLLGFRLRADRFAARIMLTDHQGEAWELV